MRVSAHTLLLRNDWLNDLIDPMISFTVQFNGCGDVQMQSVANTSMGVVDDMVGGCVRKCLKDVGSAIGGHRKNLVLEIPLGKNISKDGLEVSSGVGLW